MEVLFHNETTAFIQDMSKLLSETVKQHHIVDSGHNILDELNDKVKIHMNEISKSTKNTNDLTDNLYSEGKDFAVDLIHLALAKKRKN
ncbi:hypothetical protein K9O30_06350 [Clostridium bowmanii]|uniref:hypothetical protein n=1 Tax=Clostridium bowmanii TaxID=132925 RepID=UPI001C0AC0FC|nr:hypothetical protein [Clostridium bowmanii]MBU3188780.1 hypothetical protein [Clostridium bowmanii]MCA1073364.1 hypothetical protein [Clostridium bowmanii]